ncbi:DUF2752 domain-containing protein [Chitinilyticum piscinae]|uniref:DUF2752 domain-containing protein n=1 Tax=Chitinilyticum piscinae TaxID=2866724 RepID=A0A8J7K1A9_9NEIS|nr:DUF2752 domain-containing protein [Chitinilyticum piscinae]MBE9608422.1 DUF2752 domain-containing protein [Chitinilyticum piscinae]
MRLLTQHWRWFLLVPAAIFLALATYHVYHHDPEIYGGPFLPCIFYELTGFYCPGCGATRAVYALLHLDPARALRKNAFLVLIGFPLLAVALVNHFGPRRFLTLRMEGQIYAVFFSLAILFTVLRNLPLAPFNLLAPH